jgi:hypothetical protein
MRRARPDGHVGAHDSTDPDAERASGTRIQRERLREGEQPGERLALALADRDQGSERAMGPALPGALGRRWRAPASAVGGQRG